MDFWTALILENCNFEIDQDLLHVNSFIYVIYQIVASTESFYAILIWYK